MSRYTFNSEEPVWYRSEWVVEKADNGDPVMEEDRGDVEDSYEFDDCYYWISSEERDDVLVVPSFMEGEKALIELESSQKMFEDFVEEEEGFKIVDEVREVFY